VAVDAQLILLERKRLAAGHAQLPFDQVEPGDRLGDRMLHLQPRVHLHEEEAQVAVRRRLGDELHRARAHVAHRFCRGHGSRAHLAPASLAHAGRGRLFQHLLVAALHRAVALEQVEALAMAVAEYLDLDVPRPRDVAFDQHRVVAEAVARLALAGGERGLELLGLVDDAHALAAAAGAGLDQHRVADAVGLSLQQRRVLVGTVVAGHQRHAGFLHQLLGLGLQAHRLDCRGRRADEHQAGIGAGLREVLVLAEEAIARVDRLRAGGARRLDDALAAQVAVARCVAADVHRLVAGQHVFCVRIGVGVDGDRAHAEAARGGGHAAGDLAAVGNQDLGEHRDLTRSSDRRLAATQPT
jgi:hypothetical protein